MHTKVDLQIAQCARGVCALQSFSFCNVLCTCTCNIWAIHIQILPTIKHMCLYLHRKKTCA